MRQQVDLLYSEISGSPEQLIAEAEQAIKQGATHYNTLSGKIVFFRMQDEREYLEDMEKRVGINLRSIKARLKQIREGNE